MKKLLTQWESEGFEDQLRTWQRIALWRDRLWRYETFGEDG